MIQRLTRRDAAILDLDQDGLDAAAIAAVIESTAEEVRAVLLRHADRRRAGTWRDAA